MKAALGFIALSAHAAILYGLYLAWHPLAWIFGGIIVSYVCTRTLKETKAVPPFQTEAVKAGLSPQYPYPPHKPPAPPLHILREGDIPRDVKPS